MTDRLNPWVTRLATLLVIRASFAVPPLPAQSTIPMVSVQGGAFVMGNPRGEPDERATRRVTLGSFLMSATEITQVQFQAVMAYNPSFFKDGADAPQRPVERVSWIEATLFCNELSIREGLAPAYYRDKALCTVLNDWADGRNWHTGEKVEGWIDPPAYSTSLYHELQGGPSLDPKANGYRLPTEAQWEYAASGGSATKGYLFCGGNRAEDVAWSRENASGTTHPVGRKAPNEIGLYDMGGNVWEWCWDGYGQYDTRAGIDPLGPAAATRRVQRGGSWVFPGSAARPGYRFANGPATSMVDLGFRVVRLPPAPNQPTSAAVFEAARSGTLAQVRDVLGRGGRLDIRDADLRTPLIVAASANPSPEVVGSLVDAGSRLPARDRYGATALLAAASFNSSVEVLKALFAAGARRDVRDGSGRTALMQAARSNPNQAVIEALMASGAKVADRDTAGATALMAAAAENPVPEVTRALLRAGAAVNDRNKEGETPLMAAVESNPSIDVVKLLLGAGAKVNEQDTDGRTALLRALETSRLEVLWEILVAAGADAGVKDASGKTARQRLEQMRAERDAPAR